MEGYQSATYGQAIADLYDDFWGRRVDYEAAAQFLSGLAGGGPVLELGIGTGLFALPLLRRSLEVHGIEISAAMIERLRSSLDGQKISVTLGDFEHLRLERTYPLVYSTFCSFPMALLTAEAQARAMERVAAHVAPGGRLVIEQKAAPWSPHQLKIREMGVDKVVLLISDYDPASQIMKGSHVVLSTGGVRLIPYSVRYVSASELDLLARVCGLRLVARYGGWSSEPFTHQSADHISVYQR